MVVGDQHACARAQPRLREALRTSRRKTAAISCTAQLRVLYAGLGFGGVSAVRGVNEAQ